MQRLNSLWPDKLGGGGNDPRRLFAVAGSRGGLWVPADWSTLATATDGTGAVTTAGQSVAYIRDLSGQGNHATQTTAGSRALSSSYTDGAGVTRRSVQFDGNDDFFQTPAIDFSNRDEVTVVVGARKLSDASAAVLVDLTISYDANNGAFSIMAPVVSGSAGFCFLSKGTISSGPNITGFSAPVTAVLSMRNKISTDSVRPRINGIDRSFGGSDQGVGNYSNAPIFIGARGGLAARFNGHIAFILTINRLLTASELASVEAYANSWTGAY